MDTACYTPTFETANLFGASDLCVLTYSRSFRSLGAAGFVPYQLVREHWVRANGLFGATSQPQLVWAGSALPTRPHVKVAKADDAHRPVMLARTITVLLVFAGTILRWNSSRLCGLRGASRSPWPMICAVTGSVISPSTFLLRGGIALLLAVQSRHLLERIENESLSG